MNNWEKWVISIFSTLQGIVSILTFAYIRPNWSIYFYNKYGKKSTERWFANRAATQRQCSECGWGYTDKGWHDTYCSKQPINQLPHTLKMLKHNAEAYRITQKRLKEQVTFWQGKYNIVKTENNTLRRKAKSQ